MSNDLELTCDVCDKPALGVCSALGPCSAAFCRECLEAHRVPYWNLVGYLGAGGPPPVGYVITKDDWSEWVHPFIDATLAFYKKTFDEFVKDISEPVQ